MKTYKTFPNILTLSLCLIFVSIIHNTTKAQLQQDAQWAFYIAFEDATGAKDTVWILADTANTWYSTVSGLYGEVPITPDSINFQVWFYHPAENSYPYGAWNRYNTLVFPIENNYPMGNSIEAANYELPIMMRWDSTLFNADVLYEYGDPVNHAWLDNDYFFLLINGYQQNFQLLLDDHVEMPDLWNHFPLLVSLKRGPGEYTSVGNVKTQEFSIFPNPATTHILLSFPKATNANLRIFNANGVLVKTGVVHGDQKQVDLKGFAAGLYFVEIKDENGSVVKKVVVH